MRNATKQRRMKQLTPARTIDTVITQTMVPGIGAIAQRDMKETLIFLMVERVQYLNPSSLVSSI